VNDINIYIFAESNDNNSQMKKYKVREVIKLLEADGWVKLKGSGGDHRQFKHPTKKGRVTVRGHESEVLSQFLLNSIWKQAGWK
jgi:predicted RNA binding protein YcfA (HicA-like mRNA interferase family)